MKIEVQKYQNGELVSQGSYTEGTDSYDSLSLYLRDMQAEITNGRCEGILSCIRDTVQTCFQDRGFTWKLIQVSGGDGK